LDKDLIITGNYIEKVEDMLNDVDASVVTNALMVLEEINITNGGIKVTSELVMSLLNRMGEFSEWGLGIVLDLVSRYFPQSEDETFAIMNVLDPLLRHSSSSAVLSTVKCFVHLIEPYPDMLGQVMTRAKPPMLTLITGGSPEIQYALLKHLEVLLPRKIAKGIFADEYRSFFVRYNEPPHVKHLKVGLLPMITNEENVREIAAELCEYVCDVDAELSKRAIHAIGEITIRNASVSSDLTIRIIELIDLDMAYVRCEALKVLGNVVRVFPALRAHLLPNLPRYLRTIEDPDARAVIVWMLGEFGEEVVEAPYVLESVIDSYGDEVNVNLKLQMLSSAMKLFYKRPPEMQAMLGRLLSSAVNDNSNQDVHDKALLYYRLLTTNTEASGKLFGRSDADKLQQRIAGGGNFAEETDEDLLDQLFAEFNTLAVIYGKPSKQFIADEHLLKLQNAAEKREQRFREAAEQHDQAEGAVGAVQHGIESLDVQTTSDSQQSVNLLDWGDDSAVTSAPAATQSSSGSTLALEAGFSLSPADFQQYWGSFAEAPLPNNNILCCLAALPDEQAEVEQSMAEVNVGY
jgi:vesicle coat complex subunit